jgi:hypothetical protein
VGKSRPAPQLHGQRSFRAATVRTWEAWWQAGGWDDPADVDAAHRLIRLVDDLNRATTPKERRLLTNQVRLGEGRLGLGKPTTKTDEPEPAATEPYSQNFPNAPAHAEFTTAVGRLVGVATLPPDAEWWAGVEALSLNERIALEHALCESDLWREWVPGTNPRGPAGRWNLLPGAAQVLDRVCNSLWALE